MLRRVTIDGVELPRLYIAENQQDVALAKRSGIPYVKWTKGMDNLIKVLLRPTLERMFPGIYWNKVLGERKRTQTKVELQIHEEQDFEGVLDNEGKTEYQERTNIEVDDIEDDMVSSVSTGTRLFDDDDSTNMVYSKLSIEEYIGDLTSCVNLEVLQKLKLMPSFIGDILSNIKRNVAASMYWQEGYNKKHGACLGNYNRVGQLPNLIILDVSGSIPRGISATMLTLIDTLRTQCNADLIITSSFSKFYPAGSDVPDPDELRREFGFANESKDFFRILDKNIKGKHYGHVISFGDNDTPSYAEYEGSLMGTKVEHVHHYFVKGFYGYYSGSKHYKTGYAKWCHMLADEPLVEFNYDWCSVMKGGY